MLKQFRALFSLQDLLKPTEQHKKNNFSRMNLKDLKDK
jgi:hypothetical protein